MTLLAVTRGDVADYVSTLVLVYVILIFVRIIMSWIPRIPYYRVLDMFLTFVKDVTDPYLNLFRRILPPVRLGGAGLDLSPMVATLVLIIGGRIVVALDPGLMSRAQGWARALATVAAVLVVDQSTKYLADSTLDRGESVNVFFGLDLTNTRNNGVAFGALGGAGEVIAVLISLALVLLLGYFALNASEAWLWLPVGLLLGGAIGNLIDRARGGGVIDFIDPVLWPVFNIADVAIVVGVFALLYVVDRQAAPS